MSERPMHEPLSPLERMQFLAAVQPITEVEELAEAALPIAVEVLGEEPAPWAVSDPLAAERYLAARGATPDVASDTANAAEFELTMRALYALYFGRPPQAFAQLAEWVDALMDGGL